MISHSLFLSLLFATLSLSGMEKVKSTFVSPPQSARLAVEENFLRVHNSTNDTLLVRYQAFDENRFCHRTLIPGQWLDFARIGEIAFLQVKALGYKWISAEPIRGLANLCDFARKEAQDLDTPGVKVTVRSLWNSATTRSKAAYALANICETVLPYRFECQPCDRLEVYSKLTDIFPQVEKALQDKVLPEPRHFLSLPEQATVNDTQKAYKTLINFWELKQKDADAETQRFARDVIRLINTAYKALTYQDKAGPQIAEHQQEFRLMVQEKLFKDVQTYNAQSNIVDALKAIIQDKGRAIKGATSCEGAAVALEDLKKTCPRFKSIMLLPQANELIIYWLAESFFRSFSIEALAHAACALHSKEALDWLKSKIEEEDEWQTNSFLVFGVFEHFNRPFFRSLAKVLSKDSKALNLRNTKGNTPLMEAVVREDFETAYYLLNQNADRSIINNEKKMAFQLAQERRNRYTGQRPQEMSTSDWDQFVQAMRKRLQWDGLIAQLAKGQLAFNPQESYVG